jgi:membrane associated rhomboid family serine protease
MGLADRDYYRQPPPQNPFGNLRNWSYTNWLIAINIAVYILNLMSAGLLNDLGCFQEDAALSHLQIWRFFTFQFLHATPQHIFGNMIALYFVGPSVELVLGRRRFLAFYLICGFAGPLMFMLFSFLNLLHVDWETPMVGASAGIFGLLIACAVLNPRRMIYFNFIIPMTMRTMALILLGLAVVTILFDLQNAGGEAAHLGGAAVGFLLIKNPDWLNWANYRRGPRMRYRP